MGAGRLALLCSLVPPVGSELEEPVVHFAHGVIPFTEMMMIER